jgi:hypothetical protein
MSGVFPITAGFETLDFQSNTNSRVSVSVSGKTQRIKTGAQFWSFKLKSPAMTRAQVMADFAFIVQQDGQVESFTIVPPEISTTSFYPPLVTGITNSTTLTYNSVPIKVYFDKDEQKYITQADGTFKYEIVMNEEI